MSAIFVHAWWRSSSTYVWSRLRRDPALCCYYEPLHEQLASLDPVALDGPAETEVSRLLRHPLAERHYFAEYRDLVASGRLGYSQDLAYTRYLLRPAEPDEALRTYLDRLIAAAAAAGCRPVLCFCRSQMRSAWMKQVLGGHHVAQIRNPLDQWGSFQVNPYFVRQTLAIALRLRARHPRAFVHLEHFEQQVKTLERQRATGSTGGAAPTISRQDVLGIFLVLWIASALQSIGCGDRVLDVDRLSTDADYQAEMSRWFGSLGCDVDFSDCRTPIAESPSEDAAGFEGMVVEAAKACRTNASSLVIAGRDAVAQRLRSLSTPSRRILEQALPAS